MKRWILLLSFVAGMSDTKAEINLLPEDVIPSLLSEAVPFTFKPSSLSSDDYGIEWVGSSIPGLEMSVEPGSLEWVRISPSLDLPRFRIQIKTSTTIESGFVQAFGFIHPMVVDSQGHARVRFPAPAMTGESSSVDVTVFRNQKKISGRFHLKLLAPKVKQERTLVDTSCSPYGVSIEGEPPPASLVYVGCRMVNVLGEAGSARASLEMVVFWDGVGKSITLNGGILPEAKQPLWRFKLESEPKHLTLASPQDGKIQIRYFIPDPVKKAYLGLGLGPYLYHLQSDREEFNSVAPVATLYGSYFLSEKLKVVMFDAIAIHRNFFSDLGVYLLIEQVRAFDERFSVNLLLGGHAMVLRARGETHLLPGGPQGIEMVFRDFLKPQHSLSAGSFVYPNINETLYYNVWARWGKRGWFLEFNYIAFREKIDSVPVYARSAGITFGMPIGTFF